MIQKLVQATVRDSLRTSLEENHKAVALVLAKSDLQNSRFLKVAGENAALKAGVQLLLPDRRNIEARATVEDQLRELCERMGFALLVISGTDGSPLAGVLRVGGAVGPLDPGSATFQSFTRSGLMVTGGLAYQMASVPIDQGDENLGTLSVGEAFDLSQFTTPAVLFHNGHVLKSSVSGVELPEVEAAMRNCPGANECDVRLHETNYISLPMQSIGLGRGNLLRSLQNLDSAVAPVQNILRNAFGSVALGAVLMAMMVSLASSGSIVRPIATLVQHLKAAERTGDLMEFRSGISSVPEIRGLIESFNRAAGAVREGRENLTLAYVEFVQSLANALDARDPYTAGHSQRVSEMSRRIAQAMSLPADTVERVRVGALLHDIGKIGIADSLLRKPGRLTAEEFALVAEHPVIGRRILEGVHGFSPYLAAVELHHENWDGRGYPHGQAGENTPVDARIIHVADAYDAMVTDRPYRNGMTHEEALQALKANAGTQFDPEIVRRFTGMEFPDAAAQNHEAGLAGHAVC